MIRPALAIALTLVIGCAVGVDEAGENAGGGTITGVGGFGGETGSGATSSTSSSSPPTSSADVGAGGGAGGAGGEGGAGGSGPVCNFDNPETCATAENLGSVSGDEGSPTIVIYGTTSRWVQVRVTENNSSIIEEDLKYRATLTSAPGMDYDLIIHLGGRTDPPDCNATPTLGTEMGNGVEVVSQEWDDNQGFGGEDDDRWLSIEVRYVSGLDCDAASEWSLEIDGD